MKLKDHWLYFIGLLVITISGIIAGVMITSNYNHDLAIDKQLNSLNNNVALLNSKFDIVINNIDKIKDSVVEKINKNNAQLVIHTRELKIIDQGFITKTMQASRDLVLNNLITDVASLKAICNKCPLN